MFCYLPFSLLSSFMVNSDIPSHRAPLGVVIGCLKHYLVPLICIGSAYAIMTATPVLLNGYKQ